MKAIKPWRRYPQLQHAPGNGRRLTGSVDRHSCCDGSAITDGVAVGPDLSTVVGRQDDGPSRGQSERTLADSLGRAEHFQTDLGHWFCSQRGDGIQVHVGHRPSLVLVFGELRDGNAPSEAEAQRIWESQLSTTEKLWKRHPVEPLGSPPPA